MRKPLPLAACSALTALALALPSMAADQASPGFLKLELFKDIGGATAVSALTSAEKFINNTPDEVIYVAGFGTPVDIADNFGGRLSGLFTPPSTGNWIFYIRSDDASELHISSDANPENKVLVASETGCCNPFADARSGTVSLTKGQPVYVEVLYKEGGGSDYAFVAAKPEEDPTPAASLRTLSGLAVSTLAPAVNDLSLTQQPSTQVGVETKAVTFQVKASVTPASPLVYQWTKDGADLPGATAPKLTLKNLTPADAGKYACKVYALGGVNKTSSEAVLTIVPDTFPPAVNLGSLQRNGAFEVSVSFDEDVQEPEVEDAANFTVTGATVESSRYVPQAKSRVYRLQGAAAGSTVNVTVRKVKDIIGNPISSASKSITLGGLSWSRQGDLEINRERGDTFNDDAVALGETDFDLVSSGSNHWDQYDESVFVYEQVTGDFDRVVRVEYSEPSSQWARAGLNVRESLDEGVTRAQATAKDPAMGASFTVRVNPVVQPDGAAGNNSYEVVSRPLAGLRYDPGQQPVQFRVVNGFGGAPPYPDAWMRIQRSGSQILYYKSDDGVTWSAPASSTIEDDPNTEEVVEALPDQLYVGIFYAPELKNNNTDTKVTRSTHAIFREYGKGPTETNTGKPTISISGDGKITFTGKLLAADNVAGPYSEVVGATSPYAIPAGTKARFFRASQ